MPETSMNKDILDPVHAMHEIDPIYLENATRVLQLLVFTKQPLSVDEVVDALAVSPTNQPYFLKERRAIINENILQYCPSLVINARGEWQEELTLQLSHYSIKRHLTSNTVDVHFAYYFEEENAQRTLAEMCVAYLIECTKYIPEYDKLTNREYDEAMDLFDRQFPLSMHAATHWMNYAAAAAAAKKAVTDHTTLHTLLMELLGSRSTRSGWLQLADPEIGIPCYKFYSQPPPALYYAAFGGLLGIVRTLIDQGAQIDTDRGRCGTALMAASKNAHKEIVQSLLEHGADVNVECGRFGSALIAASTLSGNIDIVKILLERGANVNARNKDDEFATALHLASRNGDIQMIEMLLQFGASVEVSVRRFGTALHEACREGHDRAVQILLLHGADITCTNGNSGTPLQCASRVGSYQIVKTILEHSTDVIVKGKQFQIDGALVAASIEGHQEVVRLLLDNDIKVGNESEMYGDSLGYACSGGHYRIVQLLLNHGAYIKAGKDRIRERVLRAATMGGSVDVMETLLWHISEVSTGQH